MFSFEEIMNFQQETRLEMILSQIDVSKLCCALKKPSNTKGPKGYDITSLVYALLAMQVEKFSLISELVLNLKQNPVLRYACGFDILGETPSESTFSRFIDKLSESEELINLFYDLVKKAKELNIIDGESVSIDATKLDSFEKAKPKKKIIDDGNHPNWGMKSDTNGNNIRWFGWKLHILCDAKSELPLDIMMTPANVYDGTVAIPLIDQFLSNFRSILKPKYYSMDSGYDFDYIYSYIVDKCNGFPIIAYNPRSSFAPPEGLNEDLQPVCSGGYPLTYWGKDGNFLKFRCPHATGRCNCPHGMAWCSDSNYGYTLKINCKENIRFNGYPYRATTDWRLEYNKRTAVERCNSRLKCNLNLDNIRSKGIKKAMLHAILNCITLVAGTIAVNSKRALSQAA